MFELNNFLNSRSDFNIFGQSRALPTPPPQSSTSNSEDELNEAEPQQPCVRISCGAEGPVAKEASWSDEDTSDGPVEATDFTVSIERVKDVRVHLRYFHFC